MFWWTVYLALFWHATCHSIWHNSDILSDINIYIYTYGNLNDLLPEIYSCILYLAFYVTNILTIYLAFYLAYMLTFSLTYILTFYLAFSTWHTYTLTFYLALFKQSIWHTSWHSMRHYSGMLPGILCDIHSSIVSGIFSDIHSGILSGILYLALEVQRFLLSSGGFRSVYDSDVWYANINACNNANLHPKSVVKVKSVRS